jgi:hypothetical protein
MEKVKSESLRLINVLSDDDNDEASIMIMMLLMMMMMIISIMSLPWRK